MNSGPEDNTLAVEHFDAEPYAIPAYNAEEPKNRAIKFQFQTPESISLHTRLKFIIGIVSSILFMTMVSCFNVPYQSLGYELTPNYRERTAVMAFKGSIQKIMELGMFATALVWENATWSDVPSRLAIIFSNGFAWFGHLLGSLFTGDFSALLELMKTPMGI